MTDKDKNELKEMIHSAVDGRFDLIEYKLTEIQAQTTKTNGRVTALEAKELLHVPNCPNVPRIAALEDDYKSNRAIKKWLLVAVGLAGTLMGILAGVLQIFSTTPK